MELVYKRRYGAQQRYKKMVWIIDSSVGTECCMFNFACSYCSDDSPMGS